MKTREINKSEMARMLGISRLRLRKMLGNKTPIPSGVPLALAAIAWGLPGWGTDREPLGEVKTAVAASKEIVEGGEESR